MTNSKMASFLSALRSHAERKSKMYGGINATMTIQDAILCATEELGEVVTAFNRDRKACVVTEAIDLAHCAMLIAMAADRDGNIICESLFALGNK